MQLTPEQKETIAQFLRAQDELFVDLPGDQRVQALSQVKQRVRKELMGLGGESVSDKQVDSLLKRMRVSVKGKKAAEPEAEVEPEAVAEVEPELEPEPKDEGESEVVPERESEVLPESETEPKPEAVVQPDVAGEESVVPEPVVEERRGTVRESFPDEAFEPNALRKKASVRVPVSGEGLKVTPPEWKADDVAEPVVGSRKRKSIEPEGEDEKPKKRKKRKRVVPKVLVEEAVEDSSGDEEEMAVAVGNDVEPEDFGDRHWLGVCDYFSGRLGQSVGMIRFAFILAGCVTGPLAVLVYLAAYAQGSQRHPRDFPVMDRGEVIGASLRLLGITGGMFGVAWILEFGAALAFLNYFGQLPEMGVWGRMSGYSVEMLAFVLVTLAPLAVLSRLPLAYRWGRTLGTIVNAGLAMYAVAVSVGLALTVVGYALGVLTQLAGA